MKKFLFVLGIILISVCAVMLFLIKISEIWYSGLEIWRENWKTIIIAIVTGTLGFVAVILSFKQQSKTRM